MPIPRPPLRFLPAVLALTALVAACRDTTPVAPAPLEQAVAFPQGVANLDSDDPPGWLIVGTFESGATNLQRYLQSSSRFSNQAARSATLPEDLTPYKAIWYVDKETPLSADDRARLAAFVARGGGLYLSGEGGCCEDVNRSIDSLVATVVRNGAATEVGAQTITVNGQQVTTVPPFSTFYLINSGVVDHITQVPWQLPFQLVAWGNTTGTITRIQPDNVLMTHGTTGIPLGAAWNATDMVANLGRLVVIMDADWLDSPSDQQYRLRENIAQFLWDAGPAVTVGGPYTGIEGTPITLSARWWSEPGPNALTTLAWDLDAGDNFNDGDGLSVSGTFRDDGDYTIRFLAGTPGAMSIATTTVTIQNRNPTMTFSAPASVVEGTAITLTASGATDAPSDRATLKISYSCDGGTTFDTAVVTLAPDFTLGATASCPAGDGPATVNVVGRVTDKDGGYTDYAQAVTVTNAAPAIASLALPIVPVAVGTPVALSANFSDEWADDGHTATIDWDDASTSNGTLDLAATSRSISATHTYASPGVHAVTLTVKDDAGAQDAEVHQYVVVYDPSAGFVTGGGWLRYDESACPVLCNGAAGRADFGFVAKYQKGKTVPSGDTRFEFHAGTLQFVSTQYEWLVVAGKRAQFKGRGTIGGTGDYGFLVTAVDDATDAFRIKIWDRATGAVVFDNKMGATEDGPDATSLDKVNGNGSIVIHAK